MRSPACSLSHPFTRPLTNMAPPGARRPAPPPPRSTRAGGAPPPAFVSHDLTLPRPSSIAHWQLRDLVACPDAEGELYLVRHCATLRYDVVGGKVRVWGPRSREDLFAKCAPARKTSSPPMLPPLVRAPGGPAVGFARRFFASQAGASVTERILVEAYVCSEPVLAVRWPREKGVRVKTRRRAGSPGESGGVVFSLASRSLSLSLLLLPTAVHGRASPPIRPYLLHSRLRHHCRRRPARAGKWGEREGEGGTREGPPIRRGAHPAPGSSTAPPSAPLTHATHTPHPRPRSSFPHSPARRPPPG